MSENRAAEAKSMTTKFYAFGVVAFTGAVSVIAMVIWLFKNVR
jgi:hypothetical protein